MRTIGLLGGMSCESTAVYYRLLNEGVRARLGGLHSARLLLWSADFAEIEELQVAGDWNAAGVLLGRQAQALETAGAEAILICTNTMHRVADAVQAGLKARRLGRVRPFMANRHQLKRRAIAFISEQNARGSLAIVKQNLQLKIPAIPFNLPIHIVAGNRRMIETEIRHS